MDQGLLKYEMSQNRTFIYTPVPTLRGIHSSSVGSEEILEWMHAHAIRSGRGGWGKKEVNQTTTMKQSVECTKVLTNY